MRTAQRLLKNLGILVLVFVGMLVFANIFYPGTGEVFGGVGQVFSGLGLWPIVVLGIIIMAFPRKRK